MSERCIVRVKFTPAGSDGLVRRAVSGFLRYVQHRDLHPTEAIRQGPSVSGLVKYVAHRDGAATRAELFGSSGLSGTQGRKAFVEFVGRSIAETKPQLFRGRDGQLLDRRRAVSRMIISPERSQGLDLERLTRVAMDRLGADSVCAELRWIAAIHRNTDHHHVHLVVAGLQLDGSGHYRRLDITKARLAAIKQSVGEEIERQRGARLNPLTRTCAQAPSGTELGARPTPSFREGLITTPPAVIRHAQIERGRQAGIGSGLGSVLRLRSAARIYQRQIEREQEEEARKRHWELVA